MDNEEQEGMGFMLGCCMGLAALIALAIIAVMILGAYWLLWQILAFLMGVG